MILVDSSGWIEYLAARSKAEEFKGYIQGGEFTVQLGTRGPNLPRHTQRIVF